MTGAVGAAAGSTAATDLAPRPWALGELPRIAFLAALGLVVVAIGDTLARFDVVVAPLVWWLGLLLIVVPIGARLIGREAARRERIALVVLAGVALYGVKILGAPASFLMLDEFLHWATLDDIVVSGRLFTTNSILLASPYYPGLEIASDLLVRAGFSTWEAGVLVVGLARVLLMVALFLLYERASGDSRLASVGALIYAANPGFLFFDAQFAYESLALPLAVFVMWCIQRREVASGVALPGPPGPGDAARSTRLARAGHPLALTGVLLLAIGAVVVTHHVTALALSACLVVWALVGGLLRLRGARPGGLAGPAVLAVTATAAWMLYVASVTVGYLVPALGGAVDQVFQLIAGDEGSRELFSSSTGVAAPAWEQVIAYGSVLVMVLALPVGLPIIRRRWRTAALPHDPGPHLAGLPGVPARAPDGPRRGACGTLGRVHLRGCGVRGRHRGAGGHGYGDRACAASRLALRLRRVARGTASHWPWAGPSGRHGSRHGWPHRAVHGWRHPGHRALGAAARALSRRGRSPVGEPPGHRCRGVDPGCARPGSPVPERPDEPGAARDVWASAPHLGRGRQDQPPRRLLRCDPHARRRRRCSSGQASTTSSPIIGCRHPCPWSGSTWNAASSPPSVPGPCPWMPPRWTSGTPWPVPTGSMTTATWRSSDIRRLTGRAPVTERRSSTATARALAGTTPVAARRSASLVLAGLGLGAGFVLTQPSAPAGLVALAGALLAFGVPGLALTRALFPGSGLGRAERMALAWASSWP